MRYLSLGFGTFKIKLKKTRKAIDRIIRVRYNSPCDNYFGNAGVAQLAEQLICNQQVGGSIPLASSKIKFYLV